uniref:Uncharacterized protein n=1 Tax=Marseillevirus LCMAC202 TaxID=2506606 RepID=A0A481Z0V1_9VIRU|nr:MAG: hypothetical protein LCMAC202_06680 [Marseillevirus LCMAC202]
MLERLTKDQLLKLSKDNHIPQIKSMTKTGIISIIMSALTRDQIVKEVSKFNQN